MQKPLSSIKTSFCILILLTCSYESEGPDLKATPGVVTGKEFPEIYKVSCTGSIQGCSCNDTGKHTGQRLYHAEAVELIQKKSGTEYLVQSRRGQCLFPAKQLNLMEYYARNSSPMQQKDHVPMPLNRLVDLPDGSSIETDAFLKHKTGQVWPTYYHLALEDFHPGPKVPVKDPNGRVIANASQEFLDQVRWEGSGIASDGTRLRWAGRGNLYQTYKPKWGWGAGHGYQVYPYRTIAVNFRGICNALKKSGRPVSSRCGKAEIIGRMAYIPEIAERNIVMPGGKVHDGYFCITDTGSPNYIKSDRIDIFAGLHGGGNPFLPPGRRGNYLIEGGVENLVPSDWRLWKTDKDRVWCNLNDLPSNGGSCTHDYHTVAKHKALTLHLIFDKAGKPVKCKKNP